MQRIRDVPEDNLENEQFKFNKLVALEATLLKAAKADMRRTRQLRLHNCNRCIRMGVAEVE